MYPYPKKRIRSSGAALLIVLAMVVIVSLTLVAFVTAMRIELTASASYSQSISASEIAHAGLNLVIADLQKEMRVGAPPDLTYPGKPLYTNITSANILPQCIGTNAAMPNLIRVSTSTSYTNGSGIPVGLAASMCSSYASSANGRYISASRWSAPRLGDFPDNSKTPNWVIVTRQGPTNGASVTFTGTGTAINNRSPENLNYAIGRFAYAVYDQGGLLDITAAGYPTDRITVAEAQALKGTLAGVALSGLGVNPVALTQWRNAAHVSSGVSYMNYVTGFAATNAFRRVAPGDMTFLSRQDLIKAAVAEVAGLTPAALPSLTTFTRERNAPGWRPIKPAGSTIDYAAQAMVAASTNVYIPYIRRAAAATVPSYRVDGTPFTYNVQAGDPLVYYRFPLDRIRWIGPDGPQNGGSESSIRACFGLKWDVTAKLWKYVGATANTEQSSIKTLKDVLDDTSVREPNFFELLQAGILHGSLATDGGSDASYGFKSDHHQKLAFHILRIGASILSQYESSGCPVVIEYNEGGSAWRACGIENLPYVNSFTYFFGYTDVANKGQLRQYLVPSLWNPHQGVSSVPVARPPIRLRMKGSFGVTNPCYNGGDSFSSPAAGTQKGVHGSINATMELSTSGANNFAESIAPVVTDLPTNPGAGSSAGMTWTLMPAVSTNDTTSYLGYRLPDFSIDLNKISDGTYQWSQLKLLLNIDPNDLFNIWLEYKTPGNVWIPYQYGIGINDEVHTGMRKEWSLYSGVSIGPGSNSKPNPPAFNLSGLSSGSTLSPVWALVDPTSVRFNFSQAEEIDRAHWTGSLWSSTTTVNQQANGIRFKQLIPPNLKVNTNTYSPAWYSRNNGSVPTTILGIYSDRDGVRRIGDSGLYTSSPSANFWEGNPYARTTDRPIILNRPFYSVGELGYVSRDYPWRTLDFFSSLSADAGLLDLFTVSSSTEPILHGRISLNSANITALTSVIQNTMADIVGGSTVANPGAIAAKLVNLTHGSSGAPLIGKDELVTKFASTLKSSDFGDSLEQNIKTRREAVVRALGDVGQTRTWNLFIDLIAQAGRYAPNATALDQFLVEGERRYWLHVAIDRLTGEILDQQIEVYAE